jgi:hypothetical protein
MAHAEQIHLPEILDISAFEALHASLQASTMQKGAIIINAEKVERLTTPCAQLLVAFLREDSTQPQRNIIQPSPAMAAAWADFGLHSLFPLEQS